MTNLIPSISTSFLYVVTSFSTPILPFFTTLLFIFHFLNSPTIMPVLLNSSNLVPISIWSIQTWFTWFFPIPIFEYLFNNPFHRLYPNIPSVFYFHLFHFLFLAEVLMFSFPSTIRTCWNIPFSFLYFLLFSLTPPKFTFKRFHRSAIFLLSDFIGNR